jgi:hypothetical protein
LLQGVSEALQFSAESQILLAASARFLRFALKAFRVSSRSFNAR